jgi:hypothetical protein
LVVPPGTLVRERAHRDGNLDGTILVRTNIKTRGSLADVDGFVAAYTLDVDVYLAQLKIELGARRHVDVDDWVGALGQLPFDVGLAGSDRELLKEVRRCAVLE